MKKPEIIVLLFIVIVIGLLVMNSPVMKTEEATSSEDVAVEAVADNMITPTDMSEEAQSEMFGSIMGYNQCMMQNRLEYHQAGIQVASVADKTLQICEPHLDTLREILTVNNVNEGLRDTMVSTMRSRAARKLRAAVMQSMAGQAAAASNAKPAETQQ